MKKLFIVAVCSILLGCASVEPSQSIANNTKKEIQAIGQTVERLEKQTPKECRTDAFIANLKAIETQVTAMVGRVDSISESCKVEKQVLNEKITNREIVIISLFLLVFGLFVLFIKRR